MKNKRWDLISRALCEIDTESRLAFICEPERCETASPSHLCIYYFRTCYLFSVKFEIQMLIEMKWRTCA